MRDWCGESGTVFIDETESSKRADCAEAKGLYRAHSLTKVSDLKLQYNFTD